MDVTIQLILKMEFEEDLCTKKLVFGDSSSLVVY